MVKIEERRIRVLKYLQENKPKHEIAKLCKVHINTISKDVKWLKENITYDFTLTTNKILSLLEKKLNSMTNYELLSFLKLLIPTKIEAKVEGGITIQAWDLGNAKGDLES